MNNEINVISCHHCNAKNNILDMFWKKEKHLILCKKCYLKSLYKENPFKKCTRCNADVYQTIHLDGTGGVEYWCEECDKEMQEWEQERMSWYV